MATKNKLDGDKKYTSLCFSVCRHYVIGSRHTVSGDSGYSVRGWAGEEGRLIKYCKYGTGGGMTSRVSGGTKVLYSRVVTTSEATIAAQEPMQHPPAPRDPEVI